MTCIKELQSHIEVVRESLANNIQDKKSLLDPEIVSTSQLLDNLLNEYTRLNKIIER